MILHKQCIIKWGIYNNGGSMKRTAWNANMGSKNYTTMPENQMGPLPTMKFYLQRRLELVEQNKRGEITSEEMNKELRVLRGIVDV